MRRGVLLLLAARPLFTLAGQSGECDAGDDSCAADETKDTTAMLQHPKQRELLKALAPNHVSADILHDFVHPHGGHKRRAAMPARKARHASEVGCKELGLIIGRHPVIDLAHAFWKYICHHDIRDYMTELKDACCYFPGNHHTKIFFEKVEGANPYHFIDMIEDSCFAQVDGKCPTDIDGHEIATSYTGAQFKTCELVDGSEGFIGRKGRCVAVDMLEHAPGPNVKVFRLNGMMGLDPAWEYQMSVAGNDEQVNKTSDGDESLISEFVNASSKEEGDLKHVPKHVPISTIPMRFYVCDVPGDSSISDVVTEELLDKQMDVINGAYSGEQRCRGKTVYDPDYFDTRLRFTRLPTKRITSYLCAYDCTNNIYQLNMDIIPREDGMIKVLMCPTDLLGIASFPGDPQSKRSLIINPETCPGRSIQNYNEGDTLVHESGHYLGLFHTFQGGCGIGDKVKDTPGEYSPNYGCPSAKIGHSCAGPNQDPVHNFMDYSDDRCMCSFTKGQVFRMHKQLQQYQDDLLAHY